MRQNSLHKALIVMCAAAYLAIQSEAARANTDNSLTVKMMLAKTTISAGEPIVLNYQMSNSNADSLDVEMGLDGGIGETDWVRPTLTDSSGRQVSPLPDSHPRDSGGFHFNGAMVEPQIDRNGYLVASKWFALSHPGNYTLRIHVHLPYFLSKQGFAPLNTRPKPYEKDFTFPLTVTKANPANLSLTADSLLNKAIASKTLEEARMLVQSLFSMPEAYAGRAWNRASDTPALQNLVPEEAARISSRKTLALLARIAFDKAAIAAAFIDGKPYMTGSQILLHQVYDRSAGSLRQYIQSLVVY